jgi:hypothetical protein
MKVNSKDAGPGLASFALLFVKNYAILDFSDKISAGGGWIPKCYFFTALKSDNAPRNVWRNLSQAHRTEENERVHCFFLLT